METMIMKCFSKMLRSYICPSFRGGGQNVRMQIHSLRYMNIIK